MPIPTIGRKLAPLPAALIATVVALASCASAPPAPLAVEAAPDMYRVIFENDDVRVVWINIGPGEKVPELVWHPYPGMLLLGFANDSNHWRFTNADGSSVETPPTVPGLIVLCSDPAVHMGENLASVRQQGIRFELKNQPMGRPYCPPPPG